MQKRILVILMLLFSQAYAAPLKNQLANHASPYLAMHGQDPVHWQEWNQQTVATAQRENKLLFVSSGYFSCHWCHVMQRESYQHDKIAKYLNRHFIPVKVDRELNSALDARLIDFVERTQGYAGWPLNIFITPEGYPLVGMVYMPPENFIEVLQKLSSQWQQDHAELSKIAKSASQELMQSTLQPTLDPAGSNLHARFIAQLFNLADELQGGFGQQNKFPSVPQLSALLTLEPTTDDARIKAFIKLSLNNMASQGLRDHLNGGFFRYTVDPAWQLPHFEKMLYDNALLASLYLQAADQFNNKEYEAIGRETLDFMTTHFLTEQGALAASFSAIDDKGTEGGYYVWDDEEVKALLSDQEWTLVKLLWQLDGDWDVEGAYHLAYAVTLNEAAKKLKQDKTLIASRLTSAKNKLRLQQAKRGLPKDTKMLAGWNGLALSAFVQGARLAGGDGYKNTAAQIQRYLSRTLWDGKTLRRAVSQSGDIGNVSLEDYAYVAQGLWNWAELSGKQADFDVAAAVIKQGWQHYYSAQQGWQLSQQQLLRYGAGEAVIADGVMPSPSAVLIEVSLRASELLNDKLLLQQAQQAGSQVSPLILENPFWYATHISLQQRISQ